jgi:hypothetical protein
MLRRKSFAPNVDDQSYKLTTAASAHTCVIEHAVERALFSRAVRKALGPDKLSFGATQVHWKWDKQRIVGLTKVAI